MTSENDVTVSTEPLSKELWSVLTRPWDKPFDGVEFTMGALSRVPRYHPTFSTLLDTAVHSTMERLDKFPTEILTHIFEHLDFRSLLRMCRVSWKGKRLVDHVLPYQKLMQHAPQALAQLADTRLIRYHSVLHLSQTLSLSRCVSCLVGFGEFLFLPTAERVCNTCLCYNPSYEMLDYDMAAVSFAVTLEDLEHIPFMVIQFKRRKVDRVVRYWCTQTSKRIAGVRTVPLCSPQDAGHGRYVEQEGPVEPVGPVGRHLCRYPLRRTLPGISERGIPNGCVCDVVGVAAISPFPYVTKSSASHGHYCIGCAFMRDAYHGSRRRDKRLPPNLASLYPTDIYHLESILVEDYRRRRTDDETLAHIRHCPGIRPVLRHIRHKKEASQSLRESAGRLLSELAATAVDAGWDRHRYDEPLRSCPE